MTYDDPKDLDCALNVGQTYKEKGHYHMSFDYLVGKKLERWFCSNFGCGYKQAGRVFTFHFGAEFRDISYKAISEEDQWDDDWYKYFDTRIGISAVGRGEWTNYKKGKIYDYSLASNVQRKDIEEDCEVWEEIKIRYFLDTVKL